MALSLKQAKFVAAYIGEANGNATQAARIAGYKGSDAVLQVVGAENISKPMIAAAIAEHKAAIRAAGIANKQHRVDVLNDLAGRLLRTIAARAADASMKDIPGGAEGVVVRSYKAVTVYTPTGPLGGDTLHPERDEEPETLYPAKQTVLLAEYTVDTGTLAELRATLKQAAQEVGQWSEKSEVTGKDGGPLEMRHRPDFSALSVEELRELEHIAGRVLGRGGDPSGLMPPIAP